MRSQDDIPELCEPCTTCKFREKIKEMKERIQRLEDWRQQEAQPSYAPPHPMLNLIDISVPSQRSKPYLAQDDQSTPVDPDAPSQPVLQETQPDLAPVTTRAKRKHTDVTTSVRSVRKRTKRIQWNPEAKNLHCEIGGRLSWEDVAKSFPGRTVTACRVQYYRMMEGSIRKDGCLDKRCGKRKLVEDRSQPSMLVVLKIGSKVDTHAHFAATV